MKRLPRIIPVLLLDNKGLYKTVKFKDPKYVGDPLNAVKIFNEKEVDELIFLDINATVEGRKPNLNYLADIASECFMPLCYGGGIRSIADIKQIIGTGIEKVSLNSIAIENTPFIQQAADTFGSSTICVSIDVKKNFWGKYEVYTKTKLKPRITDPVAYAAEINRMGAGEILLNSVDRDGTMEGFDTEIIKRVASEVDIPVIACGGAGNATDLQKAYAEGHASAMAAGSMFVFHGKHRAVLISYPDQETLKKLF